MTNPKVNNGRKNIDGSEKTISEASKKAPATAAPGNTAPDQDRFTRGIRDLGRADSEDGKFIELEQNPSDRRDPEESRYNEAGQSIITQGDFEEGNVPPKKANPEGSKISKSQPQTSL